MKGGTMRIQKEDPANHSVLIDTEVDDGVTGCDAEEPEDVSLSDGTECDSDNEV
jgi:hypothetical protein